MLDFGPMRQCHMRVVGSALPLFGSDDGLPAWLEAYDPDAHGGRGTIKTTSDRAKAKVFQSKGMALAYYKLVSRVRPRRPDGKPNRPLTAYHVEIVDVDVEPLT